MQIKIRGYTFKLGEPYSAGTVITKGEAQALNDLRAENIQNNLRKLVSDAAGTVQPGELIAQEQLAEIQSKITGYDRGYQFVERHTPRPRQGDIELEARAVAQERLEVELRQQGNPVLTEVEMERQIALFSELPAVIDEARARVTAKRRALSEGLDAL